MKGQENVIAMRLRGKAPKCVFINDWPCETRPDVTGRHDIVCVDGDVIQLQDWRFVVGLMVSCGSPSEIRAKALLEACKAAGASIVGSVHSYPVGQTMYNKSGWSQVWKKEQEHASVG